jgi:hypothetical protein
MRCFPLLSDGHHRISFDQVVETMKQTGHDLQFGYRETATGGLAKRWNHSREKKRKDGGMLQDGQYSLR